MRLKRRKRAKHAHADRIGRLAAAAFVSLLLGLGAASGQEAAVIGSSFAGSPDFTFDSRGAAGPSHYAEITNLGFRVTALATGTVVYAGTLPQFWGTKVALPLLTGCCFDPLLEYDHATGRWIALSLSGAYQVDSAVYLGISETSNPAGAWKGLVIDADPADLRWADYAHLGLDGSAIYFNVGLSGIAASTPFRKGVYVLPKADLTGAVPTAARLSRLSAQYPTTAPGEVHYDADPQRDHLGASTDGLHLAGYYQPSAVSTGQGHRWAVNAVYQRMSGQASGTTTPLPWATTSPYQFDDPSNPPPQSIPANYGRQPGTAIRLNNGGGASNFRVGDALYTAASGPVRGRLGIVWRRFQPSTNTIVDAGFIGDDISDHLSPSIAANADGDVVIAYGRTGPTEFGSFYCSVGRPAADGKLVFGRATLVKAGSDVFDEHAPMKSAGLARYLDYASSVTVHPADPTRFWISGPYVGARNVGSTWIAEVIVTPAAGQAPTVTAIAPATGPVVGGASVTITGTNFAAGATVTIGGLPARSVTVVSPTTIVAVTATHAAGVTDVVVTNPDTLAATLTEAYRYVPLPPAAFSRYFAEGATIPPFSTRFALVNPNSADAAVAMLFLRPDGQVFTHALTVPSLARRTVEASQVPGLATAEFSTTVESDRPVVVDRTMSWNATTAYGAHAETSVAAPALTWYLAEGATHSGFNLFYLLQNPGATEAQVRVRYLRPSGTPLEKSYTLAPTSRTNIWVDLEEFPGLGQALASTDVSAVFEVTNGQPIIVERAMYLDVPGQTFGAGHESAGITAPAVEWFLAEGATGPYFDLFVLIANPGATAAEVEAAYLLPNGTTVVKPYTVAATSRFNIWIDHEDSRLADTAVSTTITSKNGVPVIVERAMWWPQGGWFEAHNSPGTDVTGTKWALAEGEVDTTRNLETYFLMANTSPTPADVKVTLLFEDGTSAEQTYPGIPAQSRFNVPVGGFFPQAAGRRFGAIVESVGPAPAQIVVERAMYWDAAGQRWAAGTNALATKLQ
jgi:hypothetical protein